MWQVQRIKKIIAISFTILLFAAGALCAQSTKFFVAQVNPEFSAFIDHVYCKSDPLQSQQVTYGIIPMPIDLSFNMGKPAFPRTRIQSIPSSYDLRTLNKVTPVKDQGDAGACWAFASIGSLESCLMPDEEWDFSENNMKNLSGFDLPPAGGGNSLMATAYLARWSGPVSEADDPYNPDNGNSPAGLPIQKHTQQVLFLPDRSGPLDNTNIKQAIMTYGGVYTSIYMSSLYLNPSTNAYYCTDRTATITLSA